jgi:protoporphyrinogen oxidase
LLKPVLGISGPPLGGWVARWSAALPQYAKTHESIVAAIAARLSPLGPIQLAGSAYHAGGIPGAVRSGRAAARALLR